MTDLIKTLKDKTARIKLAPRQKGKAYFATIEKGIQLGYRPCAGNGTWVLRYRRGGQDWQNPVGAAADHAPSDGVQLLDFAQAHAKAMAMAAAGRDAAPVDLAAPATVARAIEAYRADLQARGKSPRNADTAKRYLDAALLAKPVAQLCRAELVAFRNKLVANVAPATVNRATTTIKAALNLAAKNDRGRITNSFAWSDGLEPLPGAHNSDHHRIENEDLRRLITAAYQDSLEFGLLVETAAMTGSRYSQLAGIEVRGLRTDAAIVMIPSSNKGRSQKKRPPQPVPIPRSLAVKLHQAAAGRAPGAPLLVKQRGSSWKAKDQAEPFERLARKLDLRDDEGELITMGALRHTSITNQLLAGTPIRLVAALHDTSVGQIERTYSLGIGKHGEACFRQGQIEIEPTLKVVA